MKIFVTGGAGYVGHVLVPRLLAHGHQVAVFDALFFGCRLPNHPNLDVIKGDIRDTAGIAGALVGQEAVYRYCPAARSLVPWQRAC